MSNEKKRLDLTPELIESAVNYNLAWFGTDLMRQMNFAVIEYGKMYDDPNELPDRSLSIDVIENVLVSFAHMREIIQLIAEPLVKPLMESDADIDTQLRIRDAVKQDPRIAKLDELLHESVEEYKDRIMQKTEDNFVDRIQKLLKEAAENGPSAN